MRGWFSGLAALLLLAGCTSVKSVDTVSAQAVLERSGAALIGVSPDGRYNATVYHGSGQLVSSLVLTAFAPHLSKVEIGKPWPDQAAALAEARERGARYLILPNILHWEDRATAWSGLPDRATVLLTVIEVETGAVLDTATIDGRSAIVTFLSETPQDLLREPIKQYARQVSGA